MRRRAAIVVLAVLALVAVGACDVSTTSSRKPTPSADARSQRDGVEVWDLRTEPSRADVGLRGKADTSAFVTDDARKVKVLLPKDVSVSTEAEIVTFESISSALVHSDKPASMDVSTSLVSPETGYEMFKANLVELGLPTTTADEWLAKTRGARSDDPNAKRINVSTGKQVGYIGFGLNIKYFPLEKNAKIQWTLDWGPDPTAVQSG